jgi:hypothetical protein
MDTSMQMQSLRASAVSSSPCTCVTFRRFDRVAGAQSRGLTDRTCQIATRVSRRIHVGGDMQGFIGTGLFELIPIQFFNVCGAAAPQKQTYEI